MISWGTHNTGKMRLAYFLVGLFYLLPISGFSQQPQKFDILPEVAHRNQQPRSGEISMSMA